MFFVLTENVLMYSDKESDFSEKNRFQTFVIQISTKLVSGGKALVIP